MGLASDQNRLVFSTDVDAIVSDGDASMIRASECRENAMFTLIHSQCADSGHKAATNQPNCLPLSNGHSRYVSNPGKGETKLASSSTAWTWADDQTSHSARSELLKSNNLEAFVGPSSARTCFCIGIAACSITGVCLAACFNPPKETAFDRIGPKQEGFDLLLGEEEPPSLLYEGVRRIFLLHMHPQRE